MAGERSRFKNADSFLVRHAGDWLQVTGLNLSIFFDGFDHHGAEHDVLYKVREEPAILTGADLLQRQISAGVEVGKHAPADVDTLEDLSFHAHHVVGVGIYPQAASEAGEG